MGEMEMTPAINCMYAPGAIEVFGAALERHSAHLRLPRTSDDEVERFPSQLVPLNTRLRIKNAWPGVLQQLDLGSRKAATELAVEAGIPKTAFNRILKNKVTFALQTLHVASRLTSVPDLKLLGKLREVRRGYDPQSLSTFVRAVLHPPMAEYMLPRLFWMRFGPGAIDQGAKVEAFAAMMRALDKGKENLALRALMKVGRKPWAYAVLQNHARLAEFVLDASLAYKPNQRAIKTSLEVMRKPYRIMNKLKVYPALERELRDEDLKVLNVALDACRAG